MGTPFADDSSEPALKPGLGAMCGVAALVPLKRNEIWPQDCRASLQAQMIP